MSIEDALVQGLVKFENEELVPVMDSVVINDMEVIATFYRVPVRDDVSNEVFIEKGMSK